MAIKEITYPGRPNPVPLAYLVSGNKIFFSTLGRGGPSSINAAETIIERICKEEEILWQDWAFFDIQTSKGYVGHDNEPRYYCVDQLQVLPSSLNGPHVAAWEPVASSKSDKGSLDVPEAIINAFLKLAYGE